MTPIKRPRTKLEKILEKKGLSQRDFIDKINKKCPDQPISIDHLSRIVSGRKKSYNITTLYRFCRVLKMKPNQILDFESEI